MLKEIMNNLKYRLRGEASTESLIKQGMIVGKNFLRMNNVLIDDSHAWLIEFGDDVTLAPRVHVLSHDASTKKLLGFTKIGNVIIGNNVFIGAESVILPGVNIGDNVIIGANSTVSHDIPSNSVYCGSPAQFVCSMKDYIARQQERMESSPVYDESWTLRGNISIEARRKQKEDLRKSRFGFVD